MKTQKKWIQCATKRNKGALHRQLNIPQSKSIPKKTLEGIAKTSVGKKFRGKTVTTLLKRRVVLAQTLSKLSKR